MLIKAFESFDAYLASKNKKEFYILYGLILALIFCIIYFFFLPSIEKISRIQKNSYNQIKSTFIKNTTQFNQMSQNLKNLSQNNIKKEFDQNNPEILKTFQKLAKNNNDLLAVVQKLNAKLNLTFISNIENNKDSISFYLQGKFEDIMEWIRNLEEMHFIFIQDLHIFYEKNDLIYEVRIKNLGILE